EIWGLAGLYVLMAAIYIFFEKVVINYRPVLEEGQTFPEPSFPSSHTMLVIAVMGSATLVVGKYIKNVKLVSVLKNMMSVMVILMVVGRMLSGVHWFTDIVAGVFYGATLVSAYGTFLTATKKDNQDQKGL
ncbi:MAG: phosphatase PAP2 family protein, partial [Lachnospiraceae bacterium]|nr:phosphatase PAP2 family protein [Lachnospiraceae bacterium]